MAGFMLAAAALGDHAAMGWRTLVFAASGAGLLALLAAAPAVLAATRLRPLAAGAAGGLDEDLGGFLSGAVARRPWMFALAVAVVVALLVTVAGVTQADPFDGAARGVADGVACLVGFAALGRYLGLRN
jgi:hypothetical protein